MTLLLNELGFRVDGYSIDIPKSGLYEKGEIAKYVTSEEFGDVRNLEQLTSFFHKSQPDIAIHFAAQPLVLKSYADPVGTFTTNVDGTLNFLRAGTGTESCRKLLVITTDKVYRNTGASAYREEDSLGGFEPYSASKAMADILTQSWSNINPDREILIARAGNVIGSFDVSENRLLPDIIRSLESGLDVAIRNPDSVRPWQHVLDCLGGYVTYINKFERGLVPNILNFGPAPHDFHTVQDIVEISKSVFPSVKVTYPAEVGPKETPFLALDSSLASKTLGWRNVFNLRETVELALKQSESPVQLAKGQIETYLSKADFLSKL